jgi:hypothetical protein
MAIPISKTTFGAAVRRRSGSVIKFGFWTSVIVLAVLLGPWEALFEENGAPPLLIKGMAAFAEGRFGAGWWVASIIALIPAFCGIYMLLRGITGAISPRSSSVYRQLGEIGDPETILGHFEAEAATPLVSNDKPRVVATPSWLMVQDSINMSLIPTEDIVWVHGAEDQTGDVIGGVFKMAGVINARQQQLNALLKDMDLVVYRKSTKESFKLTVNNAINPLLQYFLAFHPAVIVGHSSALQAAWESDPAHFIANAVRPAEAAAVAPSDNVAGIFEVMEQVMGAGETLASKED